MRHTPLFEQHEACGGKVVDSHEWALPPQFKGIIREHQHTRTKLSLFDCSHMGEFLIKGAEGIRSRYRRAPRRGYDVRFNGNVVGVVTGGTYGQAFGYGIGTAYLPRGLAFTGTQLTPGPKGLPVETAEFPFYKHGTCRN